MIDIEVCANSIESAVAAQKGGAVRVELCANLSEGGTTPAKSQIEMTRDAIDIDLNVIVRPRGGDFLYTDSEFESMQKDIELCGRLGCNGVVIGILDEYGNVDIERNSMLVDLAKKWSLSVTFHRAIDRTNNILKALEDVISIQCDRVLTSGGFVSAFEGRCVLKKMVDSYGDKIKVMAGAGINVSNVNELIEYTNVSEIHGTFQKRIYSKMKFFNPNFDKNIDTNYMLSDQNTIRNIFNLINY